MNTKRMYVMTVLVCSLSMAAGCSGARTTEPSGSSAQQDAVKPVTSDPITFKVASGRTKDDYEKYIQPIKAKYPNVTLEQMPDFKNFNDLDKMIASGNIPDIIDDALTNTPKILELDLPADLEPLVKKLKLDISKIDEQTIRSVRSYTEKGTLFFMPTNLNPPMALFYNKNIFDRFAVPYPKEGITWEEAIELAKRLSRSDNGVAYRGLIAGTAINRMQTQLSLPFADRATGKSVVGSLDGWRTFFDYWKTMYDIPGNYPQGSSYGKGVDDFVKNGNLAMLPHFLFIAETPEFAAAMNSGLKWGATTFPVFKDKPGVGVGGIAGGFMITKANKNPEAAFQIMSVLLSDEAQIAMAKKGDVTSVNKPEIRSRIFEDSKVVKQLPKETLEQILKVKEPEPYIKTKFDGIAATSVNKYVQEYMKGQSDLNTILRKADEEINQKIELEMKK